ncbi:MAG: hypothetical protein ACJ748_04425 [Flavisolibacter sp.]
MKSKKYKHADDIIEEYIRLSDEQVEIPLMIDKARKKHDALLAGLNGGIVKQGAAEDAFKIFMQIKKCEERRNEVNNEFMEVERFFKEFLESLNGKQLAYEKKDDTEKMKITYMFWLENGSIRKNR